MPLDKAQLVLDLIAMKNKPRSEPPSDADLAAVLGELADAIDKFVKSGDVTGVTVEVTGVAPPHLVIGTGTQTGVGKLT